MCAKVCDAQADDDLAAMQDGRFKHNKTATDHFMSAGVRAGDCAEAIRRLNPDYALKKDIFSAKVKIWHDRLMAGEETGGIPSMNND